MSINDKGSIVKLGGLSFEPDSHSDVLRDIVQSHIKR